MNSILRVIDEQDLWELLRAQKFLQLLISSGALDSTKAHQAETQVHDWCRDKKGCVLLLARYPTVEEIEEEYQKWAHKKAKELQRRQPVRYNAREAWKQRREQSLDYQLTQEGNFNKFPGDELMDAVFHDS